ncbi:SHOCT domain-containing protein [Streptomyces phaeochromogenes]|uniref:SHOCT domain-containing protein n=1 Tax=Streptomyces phaeochromogenes TaxID=1923 RepID=UPI002E2C1D75|nr:SHOCT domain-containing protein [Streptomyces phaeochromogenes]
MMFWYNNHDISGWGWFGMSLGMVVFWGLLITAFVLLFRALNRPPEHTGASAPPPAPPASSTPEQLLAERFARGEIDEEEYQRRLEVLRTGGPTLTKQ